MITDTRQNSVALDILKSFLEKYEAGGVFSEYKVKTLLKELGLPVPRGIVVQKNQAIPDLSALKYPLVAKISSTKITSKSNVGGVRTGVQTKEDLESVVPKLMRIEDVDEVYVEEMAPAGFELIIGGMIDGQFGPVVMLGLGGIFVEFFRDITFALAPLAREEALDFVKSFKAYKLFEGYRGRPALDITALLKVIVVVSELMATGRISEIDLNPVALYPNGAMILDAKMKLNP